MINHSIVRVENHAAKDGANQSAALAILFESLDSIMDVLLKLYVVRVCEYHAEWLLREEL